jgi:hypothetical protein
MVCFKHVFWKRALVCETTFGSKGRSQFLARRVNMQGSSKGRSGHIIYTLDDGRTNSLQVIVLKGVNAIACKRSQN